MRLLRVRLHGFGQFHRGLDVAFAPDRLNVVVGRNEAGKSTLMNAVGGVLFGFRDLNMVRKYEPWEEHDRYAAEVEFKLDDGRRLRVERDFRKSEARVVEIGAEGERTLFEGSADPRGAKAEDALYFDLLGELLGFQDEAVFRNTAFVGQSGLKAEFSEQIRRLLSGAGDVDYKGALHELHGRRAELTAENPWRAKAAGRKKTLELARDACAAAESELQEAQARLVRLAETEDELADLEARRGRTAAELSARRETASALEAAVGAAERRDAAATRRDEATRRRDQAAKLKDKVEAVGDRIRREFPAHRTVGDDFLDVLSSLGADRGELEKETAALDDVKKKNAELKPKPNTRLGVGLGVVLFATAAAAGSSTEVGLTAGLVAGAALAALGFALGRNLGTGYGEAKRDLATRQGDLEKAVADRARRIAELESRTGSLLLGRDVETASAEHREYRELMEEGRRHHAALKACGDSTDIERTFAESTAAAAAADYAWTEIRAVRPWIDAEAPPQELAAALVRARRAVAETEAASESTRERLDELRLVRAKDEARPEGDFARLQDVLRRERARTRDLDVEKDALQETIDVLDDCLKDFRDNDLFRLSEDMSKSFAKLTGGKYVKVRLGPTLEPLAATLDRADIPSEDLSQGAHDQLYFAMRLAVLSKIAERETPPLFLDDPFVNFDAERLAAARNILEGMDGRQSIMATCDRQYAAWTDAVIDLDRAHAAAAVRE